MSTEETITSLIKGVPDWHDTINSNFQTVANAIDDNINKIGDLNTSLSGVTNRFQTKKYVAMGDSITVGFVDKPYATLVGEQCNLQVVNLCICEIGL
jgi:lysophospholipase L1-like esterase